MSAGENVHNTFPVANMTISPATKLYIIVEKSIYEPSDNKKISNVRKLIIESIGKLKEISTPFVKDGVDVIIIADDNLETIRESIFEIYQKNQQAKYYLNVSSGTKGLAIGLFMMALWTNAIPYHIDKNGKARIISIPRIHVGDFQKNPNRIKILELLNENSEKCLSRKDLNQKLSDSYTPVKSSSSKAKRTLSYGVFNSLVEDLKNQGLIEAKNCKNSRKEIEYHLTLDGQFTLKFIKI